MLPTVGTNVGHTTPIAELNHDIIPPVNPWIATAVWGVIIFAKLSDRRLTPPTKITISISIPKPVIINKVDHEIALKTAFSSAAFIKIKSIPTAKDIKPTLRL